MEAKVEEGAVAGRTCLAVSAAASYIYRKSNLDEKVLSTQEKAGAKNAVYKLCEGLGVDLPAQIHEALTNAPPNVS